MYRCRRVGPMGLWRNDGIVRFLLVPWCVVCNDLCTPPSSHSPTSTLPSLSSWLVSLKTRDSLVKPRQTLMTVGSGFLLVGVYGISSFKWVMYYYDQRKFYLNKLRSYNPIFNGLLFFWMDLERLRRAIEDHGLGHAIGNGGIKICVKVSWSSFVSLAVAPFVVRLD